MVVALAYHGHAEGATVTGRAAPSHSLLLWYIGHGHDIPDSDAKAYIRCGIPGFGFSFSVLIFSSSNPRTTPSTTLMLIVLYSGSWVVCIHKLVRLWGYNAVEYKKENLMSPRTQQDKRHCLIPDTEWYM